MVDDATLRAWWHHRQGLDGRLAGLPAADVLARTGWARSVGGSDDDALRAAIARTEEFAREQLGDVRGGSLDSPASRAPRLTALRA